MKEKVMNHLGNQTTKFTEDSNDMWFDDLIQNISENIRIDQLSLSTDTATPEKKKMYNALQSGDFLSIVSAQNDMSIKVMARLILFDYIEYLYTYNKKPIRLAFDHSNNNILVWAVIKDDEEEEEDNLLRVEAKVNAKYAPYGYHLISTILEESDNCPVPSHYKSINL